MTHKICPVHSCVEVASKTFLLRISSSEIADLSLPGQFVNILSTDSGVGPLLRRPFSISRIDGDIVEFIFHAIGVGTNILSRKKPGDLIDVLGPLGQPFHTNADFDKALLVAGGLGIAPFPFLTAHLKKLGKSIETFVGFRSSKQIFTENLQNIHISTDDGSEGFNGNAVQMVEPFLDRKEPGKVKIFACGPTVMLKTLAELANRKKICCEVSLEGNMACGIGICQGCPVERKTGDMKYALVCKDGPTFLTTEVNL